MSPSEPPLVRVLETVLYCRSGNCDETFRFYEEVLGLSGRRVGGFGSYRLGPCMLLIFDADRSEQQESPPPHGTSGRAHTCFVAPPGTYEQWKEGIRDAGVELLEETEWPAPMRGRSFYFHDPAGNVLEIADRDIWPGAEDDAGAGSGDGQAILRHVLAVLAYRGGKVIRDLPEDAAGHRLSPASRTPLEILAHIGDLLAWARSHVTGEEMYRATAPASWREAVDRFYSQLAALDADLASTGAGRCPVKRLLQGPLADALTHVGQIALIRGTVGASVRGENYFVADIEAGRLGPEQAAPRREI